MEDDIIRKLRDQLSTPIDTECKVVYVLCETRKLLKKCRPDQYPLALRLYCHWALHVDLSYDSTTGPFLEKVDRYALDQLSAGGGADAIVQDLAYLSDFREELSAFLASQGLPISFCDDDRQWFTFLEAYAGVIEDGSLACDASRLQTISKVVFTKGEPLAAQGHVPFAVNWTIHLKAGRRLQVGLESSCEHPGFIVHSVTLMD